MMMDAPRDAGRDEAGPEPTEVEPALGATEGDPEHDCWAQVVADLERAVVPIRRDARRLHLPAHDVDDAVQDAICQAWSKRDEHDRTRPLMPWLRGFGRRAVLARLMAPSLTEDPGAPEPASIAEHREPPPDECAEVQESRDRMRAMLAQAPSRHREVLLARYWGGMRDSVIAQRLGVSPNAVRKRLGRALTWLEDAWRGRRWGVGVSGAEKKIQDSAAQEAPPFG